MITSVVSFGHCIICRSFYGVWLPLWYRLATVLSVGRFTVYDYLFGIFWPLYCLSVVLRCITPLVSFGHCIVCRSFLYDYLCGLAIVLSVGRFTVYDYLFGIVWPLYCLSVVLRCMITSLVSFGHLSVVLRCMITPLYLLAIVLSVGFTVYDYPFGIFWPLYCLSVVLRCMITPLVSFGHCIICRSFYGVWLPLWYRLAIVLSVGRLAGVLSLVSFFGHCIVCRSFYGVWLPLWYLLAIVLSVCRSFYGVWLPLWYRLATVLSVGRFTVYDYLFGIFWPLYCLSVVLRCMITPLVSFGHCIICRSFYGVWLPLWYRLAIVLSVGRFYGVWLPLWYLLAIVLSVGRFTVYDYPFSIFWPLYCLSVVLRCMIVSFGHCIICRSFYGVWLPLWYLFVLSVGRFCMITPLVSFGHCIVGRFTVYDYPFGIFWPLYYLSVVLRCMITPLVSFGHCIVCRSFYGAWLYLLATLLVGSFRCMITHFVSFGHCIICRSFYGVWLPLWYLLATVLSVGRFTVYDYLIGIFCPLYCIGRFTVFDYPFSIVLSVGRFAVYDYLFGIFWPLYCLSFVLRCMITPLVSFGHCIICRSFCVWLPRWYLLAIVLSVGRFTVYDYPFGIVWPLYCLSVVLRCMITPLVSFGHCIICRSFYGVWLPLWYLLATVLSVGRFTVYDYPYILAIVLSVGRFTVYDYPVGIFWPIVLSVGRFTVYDYPFSIVWPLYCLSVVLRCMITSFVSFGHCIVCRSFYGVWLPLWYLLAIVLSVGRFTVYDYPFCICWPLCCLSVCRVTVYDYPFGIFWPLYCLSVVLRCMITSLVSFDHWIVCLYDYPFGIVWPCIICR